MRGFCVILLVLFGFCAHAQEAFEPDDGALIDPSHAPVFSFWDLLTDPTQGNIEQALGFYSNGSLENASHTGDSSPDFVKLFLWRDRAWSTFDMSTILQTTAASVHALHPDGERMQIGDIAQKVGGFLSGHASHQNGLDADVAYFRKDHHEQDPAVNGFAYIYVQKGGVLDPVFDVARNWDAYKAIADTGRLDRIFMDPVIKRGFCAYAKTTGELESRKELLRRLRPLENHQDHFHVRITCPIDSPKCQAQLPPPEGDGCNEL